MRLPPKTTLTDTLFPDTTLFQSQLALQLGARVMLGGDAVDGDLRRTFGIAGHPDARLGTLLLFRPHQRSEEHTSELQSLMRISYAVFCLKKKKQTHLINGHSTYTQYLY